MKYNVIVKEHPNASYIYTEVIATNLSKKMFEKLQRINPFLEGYKFLPYSETDFGWWHKITKFLTQNKLYNGVYFDCDFHGNITKF